MLARSRMGSTQARRSSPHDANEAEAAAGDLAKQGGSGGDGLGGGDGRTGSGRRGPWCDVGTGIGPRRGAATLA